jgi:hypothetical protein
MRGCTPQQVLSPNGNPAVDGMVSIIAHELSETVTDPDLNGWFDARHAETADKCAWTYGHHQYRAANGAWANMGWDFYSPKGVLLYHRDFLIQRNLVRVFTARGTQVNYCATGYDSTTGTFQQ